MSRSLDKNVVESLNTSDPIPVYNDISQLLDSTPDDGGLFEIELLGASHPLEPGVHYLRDGNSVAILKLRLVQAFFVARETLQLHLSSPRMPSSSTSSSPDDAVSALRRVTCVILLMDPEHLTAANARKRLILSALSQSGRETIKPDDPDPAVLLVKREKTFLDSLLTSHLHRHTKSPTLWNHRRWLVETCQSSGLVDMDIVADMRYVVTVAANRHPRNYYAWCHARWLVDTFLPPPEKREQRLQVGEQVVELVKDWSLRHHTDISGWSFLYFMGRTLQPEADSVIPPIFKETLHLASSFRWTNESVWVFLRTVAASDMVGDQEGVDFRAKLGALKRFAGTEDRMKVLDNSLQWYMDYRISTTPSQDT